MSEKADDDRAMEEKGKSVKGDGKEELEMDSNSDASVSTGKAPKGYAKAAKEKTAIENRRMVEEERKEFSCERKGGLRRED